MHDKVDPQGLARSSSPKVGREAIVIPGIEPGERVEYQFDGMYLIDGDVGENAHLVIGGRSAWILIDGSVCDGATVVYKGGQGSTHILGGVGDNVLIIADSNLTICGAVPESAEIVVYSRAGRSVVVQGKTWVEESQ